MTAEVRPDVYGALKFLAQFPDREPLDYGRHLAAMLDEHPPLELLCGFAALARGFALHRYGPNTGTVMNEMCVTFAVREVLQMGADQ